MRSFQLAAEIFESGEAAKISPSLGMVRSVFWEHVGNSP